MEQIGMIARSLLLLPFCFSAGDAFGQTAKELVGSWTLVSVTVNRDGEKVEPFGPNPKGTMTFDSGHRFSLIITRSDLPNVASNNREMGTSEENKTVVQGSIAYFGTYYVHHSRWWQHVSELGWNRSETYFRDYRRRT
jgi:hypothetical protein